MDIVKPKRRGKDAVLKNAGKVTYYLERMQVVAVELAAKAEKVAPSQIVRKLIDRHLRGV